MPREKCSKIFNIQLPFLPNRPYFRIIELPSQVDLMQVSNLSGVNLELIYELNPGFNQWATDPNGPFHILLPVGIADRFQIILEDIDPNELVQWDKYLVSRGDTLISIAEKYLIDFELLKEINVRQTPSQATDKPISLVETLRLLFIKILSPLSLLTILDIDP